jgi:hypothetical protein
MIIVLQNGVQNYRIETLRKRIILILAAMFRWVRILVLLVSVQAYGADTTTVCCPLKGYKKWFYKIVILHPQLNSVVERQLFRHYLCGSGTAFLLSDDDFERLSRAVLQRNGSGSRLASSDVHFCSSIISLDDDGYFGWGLGTITCVFDQGCRELISFADIYDFNKKKFGKRKLKLELYTRVFRFLAPRSAKSFIVSYGKAAYRSQSG